MKLHTSIFFPIEIIGTIAFASSGAMVAVRKKLDLFGIIVLGVITAVVTFLLTCFKIQLMYLLLF